MADDIDNHGDDAVVDDATDSNLAATTGLGLAAAAHDQNTVFSTTNQNQTAAYQGNQTERNEFMQQLVEVRRQNVVLFEQRINQSNQLFANQIATEQANRAMAQAQQASQAAVDATNANSQALAQLAVNVKLSGGVYLP